MKVLILSVLLIMVLGGGDNCRVRNDFKECVLCKDGFYLDKSANCYPLTKNCLEGIYTSDCVRCAEGFSLKRGYCYPIRDNQKNKKPIVFDQSYEPTNPTPYCDQFNENSGRCEKCLDGYYPTNRNDICEKVPLSCEEYDQSNGKCKVCSKGLVLIKSGACIRGTSLRSKDPICRNYTKDGVCESCQNGYYVSEPGDCTQMDSNCETFNAYGHCTMCKRGYDYLYGGKCYRVETDPTTITSIDESLMEDLQCPDDQFGTEFQCIKYDNYCRIFNRRYKKCGVCFEGPGKYIGFTIIWKKSIMPGYKQIVGAKCH